MLEKKYIGLREIKFLDTIEAFGLIEQHLSCL